MVYGQRVYLQQLPQIASDTEDWTYIQQRHICLSLKSLPHTIYWCIMPVGLKRDCKTSFLPGTVIFIWKIVHRSPELTAISSKLELCQASSIVPQYTRHFMGLNMSFSLFLYRCPSDEPSTSLLKLVSKITLQPFALDFRNLHSNPIISQICF